MRHWEGSDLAVLSPIRTAVDNIGSAFPTNVGLPHPVRSGRKGPALKNLAGALHTDGGGCMLSVAREVKTVAGWAGSL